MDHCFELAKERVRKVYPKLDLSLHYLPKLSKVVVEHNSYENGSDIEESETLSSVVPQKAIGIRNAIKPPMTSGVKKVVRVIPILIVFSKDTYKGSHHRT